MSQIASLILKSTGKDVAGGESLADGLATLDALAKKLKLRTISSFVRQELQDYEDIFDGEVPPKVAKRIAKQPHWHSATEGLRAVDALVEHFNGLAAEDLELTFNKKGTPTWQWVDVEGVLFDLQDCRRALRKAAAKHDQFHFRIL